MTKNKITKTKYMEQFSINVINDISIYIHSDKDYSFATGQSQVSYLISDDYIVKLNIFIGYKFNFIQSITLFDRHSTMHIHSFKDLKSKRLTNIDIHLTDIFETLLSDNLKHFLKNDIRNNFIMKNVNQLLNKTYLLANVDNLKSILI